MKLNVNGAKLNVEEDGDHSTPAILMWNGAGCTLRMWDQVVATLASKFRIIRFDIRGTGLSSPTDNPDRQYTLEQYASDAISILDSLDVERTHVWGMAWGSRAGLAFAGLHPKRVDRVALFDASIGPADVKAQAAGHREAVRLQQESGIALFDRPDGWNHNQHPDCVAPALAAAGKFNLTRVADSFTRPLLVATGDHDPNLESSRDLVARVERARLVVMENVGHGSVLQRPDLTTQIFLDFIESK